MTTTYAVQLTAFYRQLKPPPMPPGIGILHPQSDEEVMGIVGQFFTKFYNDVKPRQLMLGINPGRFGAGITGVNFTAPRQLRDNCGIDNPWGNTSELSAEFIYEVIEAYGGAQAFYGDYFIGSVSPLGYTKDGKNINYYDDPALLNMARPFILESLQAQLAMGFERTTCICIGGAKNYRFLSAINEDFQLFERILPLPHPRFIMQYRRKQKAQFIDDWLNILHS